MNELYNHSKVKAMISLTKGEGFGRPLLEFSLTKKPIITTNWSGHKDFLPVDKAVLIGGSLTDVDDSAIDTFIIKGSKWFTANYNEFIDVLKLVYKDYDKFTDKSDSLKIENKDKFSMENMTELFKSYLEPVQSKPEQKKLILPKLNKIK